MKKAQAAMEFLMTYGWAILVVLIAIGALAYFGVLSPEQFLPEKCVISAGSGLFCEDFSIKSATAVDLRIHNILTDNLVIDAVTLTNKPGGETCSLSAAVPITADATALVPLTLCTFGTETKVKADLSITYTVGGFQKTTTGSLTGRVPP